MLQSQKNTLIQLLAVVTFLRREPKLHLCCYAHKKISIGHIFHLFLLCNLFHLQDKNTFAAEGKVFGHVKHHQFPQKKDMGVLARNFFQKE